MLGASANIPVLNLLALAIFTIYLSVIHSVFTIKLTWMENIIADKQTLKFVDKASFTEAYKKLYGFGLLRINSSQWATSFTHSSISLQYKLRKIEAAAK